MRRKPFSAVCVLSVLLILLCGCSRRYRRLILPGDMMREMGWIEPDARYADMQVLDRENRKPLEGVKWTIASKRDLVELVSDANGMIRVPFSEELRRENPRVVVDYEGRIALKICPPGQCVPASEKIEYVAPDDMKTLDVDDLTVWYSPECAEEARIAATSLREQRTIIYESTGLSPAKWGVAIFPQKRENVTHALSQWFGFPVWSYYSDEFENGTFDHLNTHEWAEATIGHHLRLHGADKLGRNRSIVDGLAEYIVFQKAGLDEKYDVALDRLQEEGVQSVNLLEEFRSAFGKIRSGGDAKKQMDTLKKEGERFPAGYALSFVFWHQLCQEYGSDVPRRFLEAMGNEKKRDINVAIATLEGITVDSEIRRKLEQADVADALRLLAALEQQ